MDPTLTRWLKAKTSPQTIYDLLAKPLFDPDVEGLLQTVQTVHRALWPYQDHENQQVRQKALKLLADLGRAEDILGNAGKLRTYQRDLTEKLADDYARENGSDRTSWSAEELRHWLEVRNVHPDRVAAIVEAMLPREEEAEPTVRPGGQGDGLVIEPGSSLGAYDLASTPTPEPVAAQVLPLPARLGGRVEDEDEESEDEEDDEDEDGDEEPSAALSKPLVLGLGAAAVGMLGLIVVVAVVGSRMSGGDPDRVPDSFGSAFAPDVVSEAKTSASSGPEALTDALGATLLKRADSLLREQKFDVARIALEGYLEEHPDTSSADQARHLLSDLALVTSEAHGRELLQSFSSEELNDLARSGSHREIERIGHPALRAAYAELLGRLLPDELLRRQNRGKTSDSGSSSLAEGSPGDSPGATETESERKPSTTGTARKDGLEVVHDDIEKVLQAPENYEGKLVIPPGFFEISTRVQIIRNAREGREGGKPGGTGKEEPSFRLPQDITLKKPVSAFVMRMREGGLTLQDLGRIDTSRVNFILSDGFARAFAETMSRYHVPISVDPKQQAILALSVERVTDGEIQYWAAVIRGAEMYIDVKKPELLRGHYSAAFLSLVITPQQQRFYQANGLDWANRYTERQLTTVKDNYRKYLEQQARLSPGDRVYSKDSEHWDDASEARTDGEFAERSALEVVLSDGYPASSSP